MAYAILLVVDYNTGSHAITRYSANLSIRGLKQVKADFE